MVSKIDARNLELARQETGKDFKLGQWFCSTGAHSETVVHGRLRLLKAPSILLTTKLRCCQVYEPLWGAVNARNL